MSWEWTAEDEITVDGSVWNSSSSYLLTYPIKMEAITPVFSLPLNRDEYVWLVDFARYTRFQPSEVTREVTEILEPLTNNTAVLSHRADTTADADLFQEDELTTRAVSRRGWRFIDTQTVGLDASLITPSSLLTLTYTAKSILLEAPASIDLEWRYADLEVDVEGEDWIPVEPNQVVTPTVGATTNTVPVYHQLRAVVHGVRDIRDLRIQSLGLKGIHLFGGSASAPGLVEG